MILVIEEDQDDRARIAQALQSELPAMRRHVASNICEALGIIADAEASGGVRLILLGFHRDGDYEGLAALERSDEARPIPVVLLAGDLTRDELMKAYRMGANSVLALPSDPDQFGEFLHAACMYWLYINIPATETRIGRATGIRGELR